MADEYGTGGAHRKLPRRSGCTGSPRASVAPVSLLCACHRHYPGGTSECTHRSLPQKSQPSLSYSRVGFRIVCFRGCLASSESAYTVTDTVSTISRLPTRPPTKKGRTLMSPVNRLRLFALSEREFKRIAAEPPPGPARGKFKGISAVLRCVSRRYCCARTMRRLSAEFARTSAPRRSMPMRPTGFNENPRTHETSLGRRHGNLSTENQQTRAMAEPVCSRRSWALPESRVRNRREPARMIRKTRRICKCCVRANIRQRPRSRTEIETNFGGH